MMQRLIIAGFLQMIPNDLEFVRLLFGLLVTMMYMVLLLLGTPYKRRDLDFLGVGSQFALVCIFAAAMCIKMYDSWDRREGREVAQLVLGFESTSQIVLIMIIFNFSILLIAFCVTCFQAMKHSKVRTLRLSRTGAEPLLTLGKSPCHMSS